MMPLALHKIEKLLSFNYYKNCECKKVITYTENSRNEQHIDKMFKWKQVSTEITVYFLCIIT